jgi:electron transport complex protein RnfA
MLNAWRWRGFILLPDNGPSPELRHFMTELIFTLISAALVNTIVLQLPLGIDTLVRTPVGDERLRRHALGIATTALMVICALIGNTLYRYLLQPWALDYLRLFVFLPLCVLLAAPLVKLLAARSPLPFTGLEPLLMGNAAVLGVSLISAQAQRGLLHTFALSLGAGLGFWLVLCLFGDLRQRLDHNAVPWPFRGLPIELIGAGLMALAFLGFTGLIKT